MKNYKSIGMVVGSLIGCILAGVLVYLQTTIVIICLVIFASTMGGYLLGSKCEKNID